MPAAFRLIAHDSKRDPDNWAIFALLRIHGKMDMNPEVRDQVAEEELAAICRECEIAGVHIRRVRDGGAGQAFAEAPWFDFFDGHVLVRQFGGRDV